MPRQPQEQPPRTVEYRRFKGLNKTDARVAIDDDEFSDLENAMTIGNGAVQILPYFGVPIATPPGGARSTWGFTLNGDAVQIVVGLDGSLHQVLTPAGTTTQIAPASSVSQNPHLTIWRASHILIGDPDEGYMSWDGTTFVQYPLALTGDTHTNTTLDNIAPGTAGLVEGMGITGAGIPAGTTIAVITGPTSLTLSAAATATAAGVAITIGAGAPASITSIAVFEARAWLGRERTIAISAPNSFANFSPSNGATSFILTDEAFAGDIIAMTSAIEQLWIFGQAAVETINNVQTVSTPAVLTTFSVTNILADLGTSAAQSSRGYIRAITFLSPFGEYALAGVTPEKLSSKLDGLFPDLTLGPDVTAAVAIVYSLPVLCLLVTFNDPAGPRPILLCFTQGKWFTASQGALTWITTVLVNGVSQAWGTDGASLFQVFGASQETATPYRISSRLFPLGPATTEKATLKVGFEFQAPNPINPDVYIDSESGSVLTDLDTENLITEIINDDGVPMTLENDLGDTLVIVAQGLILAKTDVAQFGHYLGFTMRGTDPPYRIQAFALEYKDTTPWEYGT